jgi:hypothetical protein
MAKRIAAANGASKDRHFLQACRELLEFPIVSVDVGADGGVREWGELATLCAVHAFEPRQNSFAELQRSLTESRQQYLKLTIPDSHAPPAGTVFTLPEFLRLVRSSNQNQLPYS